MKAIITVKTIEIDCPKCEETIPEPKTGSLFWDVNELIAKAIECPSCKTLLTIKVPK